MSDEREMLMEMPAVLELLAEEREVCAKLAVRRSCSWSAEDDRQSCDYRRGVEEAASQIATAIRASGRS